MVMECPLCRGELVRGQAPFTVTRHGYHLILDQAPAWVCQQCGEPLFDEATVSVIQEMFRELDQAQERLLQSRAAA